jgi:DNA-binding transcriptional LysR family regulator
MMHPMFGLPPGIDPDLLRSFVMIVESGSFTRAADRVGRTQSAVSMQMRRLEELLGHPLLMRTSKGITTTPQGAWLLERARSLLTLNDEIIGNFRAPPMVGTVRLGTPDDYALNWLPDILARFAEAHPSVELDVTCMNSDVLVQRFTEGQLDLTLLTEGHEVPGVAAQRIWTGPLRWVGSPAARAAPARPAAACHVPAQLELPLAQGRLRRAAGGRARGARDLQLRDADGMLHRGTRGPRADGQHADLPAAGPLLARRGGGAAAAARCRHPAVAA